MILNLGSLAFNADITSGGGTPAWGTELGQGTDYKFSFEDMSDFFTGMVYKSFPQVPIQSSYELLVLLFDCTDKGPSIFR